MNILITGGAGFIGSHLARRLRSETQDSVAIIDDLSRRGIKSDPDLPTGIPLYRADIRDAATLLQVMEGVDVVYHLAAVSSVGVAQNDVPLAYQVNVGGTEAILRAAQKSGVRRVIFTSSREVYGEPLELPVSELAALLPKSAYGLTKASGESCCRLVTDLDVLVLRLANVYGPGDFGRVIPIFFREALRGHPLQVYGGDQILDFIWIDDVVDALLAARTPELCCEGPLNIGSGIGTSVSDLAAMILKLTNSASVVRHLPKKEFEVTRFVADIRVAQQVLGLKPVRDPLAHLHRMLEWTDKELMAEQHLTPSVRPLML